MVWTRRTRALGIFVLLLPSSASLSWGAGNKDEKNASVQTSSNQATAQLNPAPGVPSLGPARSVDLQPLDFRRLSQLRSRDGSYHIATAFFDENRLLITFEGTEMVRRLKSCPKTHDDRIVRAVVVNVRTGDVLQRADWYLHDRQQYLWPLATGAILLRRGTSLFELDTKLHEKPLLEHTEVLWVDITPDGQQVMVGTPASKAVEKQGDKSTAPRYEVRFLDASTLEVAETFPMERPIPLKATSGGYADVVLKSGWTWLVRFGAHDKPRMAITRVRSSCIPDLETSGEHTLIIGRCTTAQDKYVVSSFTTAGQFLWRKVWNEQLKAPIITRATSGARFALANVLVEKQNNPSGYDGDSSAEVRRHRIEIYNSATGNPVFNLETQPAVSNGGNLALSPDGATLAVLREARLELYELPRLDKDESAKLAAVRAGTPGLIPPGAATDATEDALIAEDEEAQAKQTASNAARSDDGLKAPEAVGAVASTPAGMDRAATKAADNGLMTLHARSEAVVVDVVVTDSKGHPVPGLKAEDFSVTEDGTGQKINFFQEHSVVDTRQSPPPEFKRPPNIFSNVSNTTQPDSSTLILFDMLNTPIQDQGHARDALTRYIKNKPRNESFALCTLAGPLRLIRGFTTDENELLLSMLDKRFKPSASLISSLDNASLNFIRTVTQKLDTPNDVTRSFAIAMAGLERSIQDEQMSQNDMRTYMTIHAFEELARYMAGVPGRKKVLWLSAAFPLGQFASSQGLDAGPFYAQRNFVRLVSKTMNLLASAHVSVYPVDVRGVMNNSVYDIATEIPVSQSLPSSPLSGPFGMGQQEQAGGGGFDANAMAAARNMANDHAVPADGFVERSLEDSTRRNSEHSAMDLVAEQTGGKAYYGSNDITDALRATVEQGSDYYTISYTPSNRKYDGRFRKIHVKVEGHNRRVAHRSGYYAEDPNRLPEKSEQVLQTASLAGMMHGAPESRQIPFEVRLVPLGEPKTVSTSEVGIRAQGKNAPTTIKLQRYSVDYAISAGSLRFDPGPEGNMHGNFRLLANSFDSEGKSLLQAASTAAADLRPVNYRSVLSDGFRLHQELDVPADASYLRLGIGDLTTTYIGTLELPLPVRATKEDPLARKEKALPPVEPE